MTIQQVLLMNRVLVGAAWNSADKDADITLTSSDHIARWDSSGSVDKTGCVRANMGKSSGKWYWEVLRGTQSTFNERIGIGTSSASLANALGSDASGYAYASDGTKVNGGSSSAYGTGYNSSSAPNIGVLLNMDDGEVTFRLNGVSQGVAFTALSGTFYPMVYDSIANGSIHQMTIKTSLDELTYAVPVGYNLLVT